MIIAIPYDNGQIFQHFGHSEQFKIYEVENGLVTDINLVNASGTGHMALASMLAELGVDVVICGGMGEGAQSALAQVGIDTCTGVTGSADEAVGAYLQGELVSAGVNCDHHSHEDESACGAGCGSCGGGCGGCGGGCGGAPRLTMEGKNAGRVCRVHYRGTFDDGVQFDSSYDRGEPLEFVCAAGMMIPGFDAAVVNMEVGESADFHLMPEEAYGFSDPDAIFTVPFTQIPGSEDLEVGQSVHLVNSMGQPFPVTVTEKSDLTITFDANHPMAGKELNFHVELLSVE